MARTENIRVLIVDEYPIFCMGLAAMLKHSPGYSIVGETTTIAGALKIAEKEKPHLVIMDVHLGSENGMELITLLKTKYPELIILVISMHDERYYAERVLRMGAQGYIMKNAPVNDVKKAVNTILAGKVYLSEDERERILEAITSNNARGMKDWVKSMHKLSDRELDVFSLIAKGYGTIEIATKLNLSTKTIDTHREHIKSKLHCNSTQELRQLAIEWTNYASSL